MPKFIQIAVEAESEHINSCLYALDAEGNVWILAYDSGTRAWDAEWEPH